MVSTRRAAHTAASWLARIAVTEPPVRSRLPMLTVASRLRARSRQLSEQRGLSDCNKKTEWGAGRMGKGVWNDLASTQSSSSCVQQQLEPMPGCLAACESGCAGAPSMAFSKSQQGGGVGGKSTGSIAAGSSKSKATASHPPAPAQHCNQHLRTRGEADERHAAVSILLHLKPLARGAALLNGRATTHMMMQAAHAEAGPHHSMMRNNSVLQDHSVMRGGKRAHVQGCVLVSVASSSGLAETGFRLSSVGGHPRRAAQTC